VSFFVVTLIFLVYLVSQLRFRGRALAPRQSTAAQAG
jgi:hypothetical protein